ncbi:ThiF family adenylyltransferase [Planctomycetota bacterium]
MDIQIIITQECYDLSKRKFFPPNNNKEQFAFGLAGISQYPGGYNVLVRKLVHADESCLINQSGASVKPKPELVKYVWKGAKESQSCLVTFHTHPFSGDYVGFSGIDDKSEQESFPKEIAYLGRGPHASVVLGRSSLDARWYNCDTDQTEPIKTVNIIGDKITTITPTSYRRINSGKNIEIEPLGEIYNRQILALGEQGQRILRKQKVAVVGTGGIGSQVFMLLVRLGVGELVLIDPDIVEISNLNRLAGSTLKDAQKTVSKVHMLARKAAQINPKNRVQAVQASILDESVHEQIKICDVIFGCTDNQSTRSVMNDLSSKYVIPYFDTGTGIQVDSSQKIQHAGGQVRVAIPGMGCLNCINGIDLDVAQQEQLPEPERRIAIQRGYIQGADVRAPAVASLNGAIASLAVNEFMAFITGCKPLHRYVFYDFLSARTWGFNFDKDPDCFTCSAAGLLAVGDCGTSLPEYMLLDESEKLEGEIKMEAQELTTNQQIKELLDMTRDKGLDTEGDPDGLWFAIKNIKLGPPLNEPEADVMVKFTTHTNNPIILLPDKITLNQEPNVCPNFLEKSTYIKGWRCLCPHMFQDVGNEMFEFVLCLIGMLAKPDLCGLMGCEGKEVVDESVELKRNDIES